MYEKQVTVVRGLETLVSNAPGVRLVPQTTSTSAAYRLLEAENARLRATLTSVQRASKGNTSSVQALHQYTRHGVEDREGAAVGAGGGESDVRRLRRQLREVMEATAVLEQDNAQLQATHLAHSDKVRHLARLFIGTPCTAFVNHVPDACD